MPHLSNNASSSVGFNVPMHSVSGELEVMRRIAGWAYSGQRWKTPRHPEEAVTWPDGHANDR